MSDSLRRDARGAQTAGPVGINHGFLLFRSVAQATALVGLHNRFIHSCHRLENYDADEIPRSESSGGAMDYAYEITAILGIFKINISYQCVDLFQRSLLVRRSWAPNIAPVHT